MNEMDSIYILVAAAAVLAVVALKRRSGFVPVGVAQDLLRRGAFVLDVRTPDEFARGHLPGAVNIPWDDLAERIVEVTPEKSSALLLHCGAGVRSGMGKRVLERQGYTRVFNLGSYARARTIICGAGS